MATSTLLPQINASYKAERQWTPGPAYLPGTSQRDPIIGSVRPYQQRRLARSTYHDNVHQRSIFQNTNGSSSFFIIHPDWTSEESGRRKVSCKERGHYSWDGRPAVQPLSAFIDPMLNKRVRDQYIKAVELDKKIELAQSRTQSRAQSRAQSRGRIMKPMTPRDSEGRYKGFTMY